MTFELQPFFNTIYQGSKIRTILLNVLVCGKGELAQSVKMHCRTLSKRDRSRIPLCLSKNLPRDWCHLEDFLLSLQGITAPARTLFKTCSQLQRLDVKRSFSNTLQKNSLLLHSLKTCSQLQHLDVKRSFSSAFQNPVCYCTLSKRAPKVRA